ncbi:MAG: GIY-YIG nuclease family protein [Rhodobacter sp.]|nr:GIY-YIG nuclease family protein [Paracoccaceae bacterium]MCC0075682.1 GIY-YIG nuclease family protein [Rhodobacter sp.]
MITPGRSLELYFIDGRPDGMLTAEVFNWTGHVLRVPRTQLREALARSEAANTGVYLLFGEIEGRTRLYVGEAEVLADRLRDHAVKKDWWDDAVLITTAGDALHKAHVKYLEARLVEIARDVGAAELENGNTPTRSSLSEAHTANMESFLDTLMMVLPAIRIDAFLNKKRTIPPKNGERILQSEPVFQFSLARHNVSARAVLRNGEMILLAGARVRSHWVGNVNHVQGYIALRAELVDNGTIVSDGEGARTALDYAFSSPSAAAAIVAGTARNGRTDWIHTETGQTYAEWEAAQLTKDTA